MSLSLCYLDVKQKENNMSIPSISILSANYKFDEEELAKLTYVNLLDTLVLSDDRAFGGISLKCVVVLNDKRSVTQNIFKEALSSLVNGIEANKIINESSYQFIHNVNITEKDKMNSEQLLKIYFMLQELASVYKN